MMNAIELYDILTIGGENGDKDYTVANMVEHNHATYLYLIEVDKEENLIESNQLIVRRVLKDGDEAVEVVTDEAEKQEVARLFFRLFKEQMDEMESEETTGTEN